MCSFKQDYPDGEMSMKLYFPLRFKVLLFLLLIITAVVSIITFTMASLFHADKTIYIHDLISTSTLHLARETESLLQNYLQRTRFITRIAYDEKLTKEEKNGMLSDLFRDFPEVVSISFHEEGADPITVFDDQVLKDAGLSKSDIDSYRENHPLPDNGYLAGDVYISNSTFDKSLPLMTMVSGHTVPQSGKQVRIESLVRMDKINALLARSRLFEAFILDPDGKHLAHSDPDRIISGDIMDWTPDKESLPERSGIAATFEYVSGGESMIGGYDRIETGNLLLGTQIPKDAAYLSARELFSNLLGVSLVILLLTAVIGLILSHRITRPLEKLSEATREVAKGAFDIQVKSTHRDEIGNLSLSFNKMALELKDREKALKDAQAALIQSEKMSAFGQLSAGIAHEVKNPLAGILGYAQLSIKKLEDDSPVLKNLKTIERETKRCNSIIGNLMKFTRQEESELAPTEINDVVEDAIAIVAHQLGVSHVHIEKDLAAGLPLVEGSANQLQQVFMNILINAQQAMDGQPGTVRITTRALDDGQLVIRISDTGPGLPKEIQDRVFEPFFTTKPAGKGTGLGLSVTYGIIRDHGGDINLESAPGEGATFIITLPVADQEKTSGDNTEAGDDETLD
jgi:signal transduction histidine kinase